MAAITLESVRKAYGDFQVVHGIDLAIAEGEFVVLVGPSGCGKSTLLRMIAGLEDITSGTIQIGNRMVNHLPPSERNIAMVFQDYALYPHMSVEANMGFGLSMRGAKPAEIKPRVAEAARILKIEPFLERRPAQLSGGQRQRVAMGRAIVRHPDAFLFDEPLSNLDASLRIEMRLEMAKLHRSMQATTVYVTHDQVEAMTLADRIVVMNAGRVEQVGPPLELYRRPQTLFVARFIGSPTMNTMLCPVEASANGMALRLPLQAVPVHLPGNGAVTDQVILGIRPEDLSPCSESEAWWTGEVSVVEHLGSQAFAHVDVGAERLLTVELSRESTVAAGDRLSLRGSLPHLHLFHAETERRLSVATPELVVPKVS
ncbi:ABC transporter ATP-binding protein [Telmatospirillum sp. J64-1]|uniref:ABC transporter ATP-binding protein n=1 Tax=Telmatospirillum sp. J64-1 TaxID=2502183 RepID=UPI00115C44E4|nr:sn-glycerol-3-phosphate ABC transporter ATP-binding protein UgpC [Telmatospirillum sp. J64-1]